jgi:PAS domain S-box-containing protein
MNIYASLSLSASAVCLGLGIVVYYFNRKGLLNKLFILGSIVAFFYSFTDVMMWQSSNYETAYFWNKMGSMWPFFVVLVFNFALAFTESKWLKYKLTYLVLYLPAAVFSLIEFSTNLINGPPVMKYWGYNDVASQTWVYAISTAWAALLPILAFVLCFRYYRSTEDEVLRQQRKFVAIGFAIPVAAFVVTNMVLRTVAFEVPNLGIIATAFFAGFVGYAIAKYNLFAFDAAMAAENIVSAMPDSLILADMKERIFRVNKSLVDFLGYGHGELIGESIIKLSMDNEQLTTVLKELKEKKVLRNRELTVKTKSGEVKNVSVSGSIVQSKTGRNVGITCILHDITERKRMEESLVKAERLASIGELAGQIGHDLRNPLTAIKSSAYLLENKSDRLTRSERKRILGIIDDAVDDSNRIIIGLSDYSYDLSLSVSNCTPKSLVSEALLRVQIPNRIEIKDYVSDEPTLSVDVTRIETVFASIIRNAVEAIPKKGTIEIRSIQKGSNLEVSFSDSGEGIPEKILSKMFSPLNTTKAKGMGLSLAMAKRIVEAHGGKITVESMMGKGTTVTVALPSEPALEFAIETISQETTMP